MHLVLVLGLLGCAGVLRRDVGFAMNLDAQWFVGYKSDGTAAGDSAVRIAGAAVTEIEDGNEYRGMRLLDEALRRGVPDLAFYRDALGIAHLRLDPALCQLVIRLAMERFPEERWDSRQCDRMAGGGAPRSTLLNHEAPMTGTDQCEDCGQPATVAMAFMGANRPGKSNTSQQHRYCRPCAERRGVPKRESLPPKRRQGEGAKWDGLLQFYLFMEKHSLSEPEQRASAREAALQFRDFMDKAAHRDPPPAELRELIDRIIKNTA